MKPHLKRWCGMWLCGARNPFASNWPWRLVQGIGKTPWEAYKDYRDKGGA